jgi:PucR C-terminal helix-turn-helix domain
MMVKRVAWQDSIADLDPRVAAAVRAQLRPMVDEVITAIGDEIPEYARPLEGEFGHGVRTGTEEALVRFLEAVEGEASPGAEEERWRRVYRDLGRGEMREGRSLDALLGAYRVGARVAWRRVAAGASAAGASAGELTALAEAIFAYIDEISALSAEGYAAEQAVAAGEAQRRRERLVRLLIGPTPPPGAAEELAAGTEWALPGRAAALVCRHPRAEALALRLGPDVIAAGIDEDVVCALVPDPEGPGRRASLGAALARRTATLGPTVPWPELGLSFGRARALLAVTDARADAPAGRDGRGLMLAEEHLLELIVDRDARLLRDHAERELEPLAELRERPRERLLETLAAWLESPGQPTAVARELHLHPQTVRYRVARLRELLGDDFDEPDRRLSLAVALRSR